MYTKYTGIILKKYPLGEADELLTIYTREAGKLRVKAVSSRKIQSRLAGYLQSLNEVEFETAKSVLISVRARSVNNYLRENLKKFAYALIGAETLYRLTPDRQENLEAYQALVQFLRVLGEDNTEEQVEVRRFQLQLLKCCGFALPLEGGTLTSESREQLSALLEGQPLLELRPEAEMAIDHFLNYVLEREIKAKSFLQTLNREAQS